MAKKLKKLSIIFISLFFLIVFVGCHNYYKATQSRTGGTTETAGSIDNLKKQNRYFILRSGSYAWYMKDVALGADQKTLSCQLDSVSYLHQLHFALGRKRKMQYIKSKVEDMGVLKEVHLFIPADASIIPGNYTLSLDKVQKIEVIEKDKKKTTSSYVVGAIGYTLGVAVIAAVIIGATKSFCPFVSAYDGNEFSLQGEIYGGSIYPQLARHDYIPLKMSPLQDGTLQLKITNELQERQYTDIADLLVITHNKNTKVLADEKGNLYSVSDPKTPIEAKSGNSTDVLSSLLKSGDNKMLYMDDSSRVDAVNEVTIKFNTPLNASKGKLVLSLKNTYWLDVLYGELIKNLGTYYANYVQEQKDKPATELLKWIKEQQIPLEISLKTKDGWKKITAITTIGPLANREIVVPIELPATGETVTEIKLSAGFMFWEIDYAAMDFTSDNSFTIQRLSPWKATDEKGKNVLADLKREDGLYLEQPEIGNAATLVYKTRMNTDLSKTRTYILHAKGYYEHIRDFKNKPDLLFLGQFRQPNAVPVYGMHLYNKVRNEGLQSLAGSH